MSFEPAPLTKPIEGVSKVSEWRYSFITGERTKLAHCIVSSHSKLLSFISNLRKMVCRDFGKLRGLHRWSFEHNLSPLLVKYDVSYLKSKRLA